MKIIIGSDHGGFNYKNKIIDYLKSQNIEVEDEGTYSSDSCDYPVFAKKVAKIVAQANSDDVRGILICGTGIGMSITANKVKGIRAALCSDLFSAKATREHNNSNILCLGERVLDENLMLKIVEIWLDTPFSNEERHIRRIEMIEKD
ncbi:ribose 5-phosphate isomerase B [bacterium]|nr:ribose 5-phosphate isomerase B [bacterium]